MTSPRYYYTNRKEGVGLDVVLDNTCIRMDNTGTFSVWGISYNRTGYNHDAYVRSNWIPVTRSEWVRLVMEYSERS